MTLNIMSFSETLMIVRSCFISVWRSTYFQTMHIGLYICISCSRDNLKLLMYCSNICIEYAYAFNNLQIKYLEFSYVQLCRNLCRKGFFQYATHPNFSFIFVYLKFLNILCLLVNYVLKSI